MIGGEYTLASACGVVLTVLLELLVLRTGLFRDPRYWVALGIIAAFQLLVNGVLTCPPIVSYDPDQILGPGSSAPPSKTSASASPWSPPPSPSGVAA